MNYIELEDEKTLREWLAEFLKEENQDKITLPNCVYNYHEICRELVRRENLYEVSRSYNMFYEIRRRLEKLNWTCVEESEDGYIYFKNNWVCALDGPCNTITFEKEKTVFYKRGEK